MRAPDDRSEVLARLERLVTHIPPQYHKWFYAGVIDFKDALTQAHRVMRSSRATIQQLEGAARKLEAFYRE